MTNDDRAHVSLGELVRDYYRDNALPDPVLGRLLAGRPRATARPWLAGVAAVLGAAALAVALIATNPAATADAQPVPRLVAVQIHADWCARSPEVAPIFADLLSHYGNEPVLFVTLDITDDVRRGQAELLAATLGIPEALDEPFESGMIKLIDRQEHELLAAITEPRQADVLARRIAAVLDTADRERPGTSQDRR